MTFSASVVGATDNNTGAAAITVIGDEDETVAITEQLPSFIGNLGVMAAVTPVPLTGAITVVLTITND